MLSPGQLVKLAVAGTGTGTGTEIDGIVFEHVGAKVVVAVIDRTRGPVFRTVQPKALIAREEEGPEDRQLRLLIRRTPQRGSTGGRGGAAGAQGRSGFKRSAAHRTTGR